MASRWRHSLVGLQIVYRDQHAFLMETRCRVLLRNLLTLLGLVVTRFLRQPEGGRQRRPCVMMQSRSPRLIVFLEAIWEEHGPYSEAAGVRRSTLCCLVTYESQEQVEPSQKGLYTPDAQLTNQNGECSDKKILTLAMTQIFNRNTGKCIYRTFCLPSKNLKNLTLI